MLAKILLTNIFSFLLFKIHQKQCPDVGGYINEDGCPIDSDGDGVSDCASDVGGMNSVLVSSRFFPTWPFTIGHLTNGAKNVCHNTTVEPRSETTAADNCCNVAYDNCEGTPKFVDVTNAYTPSDSTSPVETSETGMGCSVDTDGMESTTAVIAAPTPPLSRSPMLILQISSPSIASAASSPFPLPGTLTSSMLLPIPPPMMD